MANELIFPYCTKAWADKLYESYVFDSHWNDASDAKKNSALNTATDFMDLYVKFKETYKHSDEFTVSDPNDYANEINPRLLKQACAQEASYLLSLDDNPAEPHPLSILGLSRSDSTVFSEELVPPIFPVHVVKLIESLGGQIDYEAAGSGFRCFRRRTT